MEPQKIFSFQEDDFPERIGAKKTAEDIINVPMARLPHMIVQIPAIAPPARIAPNCILFLGFSIPQNFVKLRSGLSIRDLYRYRIPNLVL